MTDKRLTPDVKPGAPSRLMCVIEPVTALRPRPARDVGIDTEVVFGERLRAYDEIEGWAYVQAERDGYVGYVSANALAGAGAEPTHRLAVLRSYVYAGPSIKVPDPLLIVEGSLLTVMRTEGDFAVLDTGGYVFARHLVPITSCEPNYISVAERYLGTPYLWGGRTSLGLDCSGLVQTALRTAGVKAPRDSDMLERFYPEPLPITPDFAGLQRGDAVFWKGHVGVMRDSTTLLHANGHHMLTVSEPLAEAAARILAKSFGPVTSIRRLAQVPLLG